MNNYIDVKDIIESSLDSNNRIFDKSYKIFEDFLYKKNEDNSLEFNNIQILGKKLFIDGRSKIDGKVISFWHLCSQNKDELKYDMYPCINDKTRRLCYSKCNFNQSTNFLREIYRVPCIYRAVRIPIFINIVDTINKNPEDSRIKYWKIKEGNMVHRKIRYTDMDADIDYIIILKPQYTKNKEDISQYLLITAYPIVLKSYSKRFEKEYQEFINREEK